MGIGSASRDLGGTICQAGVNTKEVLHVMLLIVKCFVCLLPTLGRQDAEGKADVLALWGESL